MALTPKERENIVEEETLRFETRKKLNYEYCRPHGHRRRWFWWLIAIVVLACLWHRSHYGYGCGYGAGYYHRGMAYGHHCQGMGAQSWEDKDEKGGDAEEKPAVPAPKK